MSEPVNPMDKAIAQFRTLEELQTFAKAQQTTLITQQKKLKAAEEKVKHLEKLLEGAVPVIKAPDLQVDPNSKDEEQIAREQLFRLKNLSAERELTLEETKRVEIYAKILISLKQKEKDAVPVDFKNVSNEELMKFVSTDESSDGKH